MASRDKINVISTELKQWGFCPRQWYYFRLTGRKPWNAAIKRGLEYHHEKSVAVKYIKLIQNLVVVAGIGGGVLCLYLLLVLL